MLVGIQIVTFGMIARRYAARQGLLPGRPARPRARRAQPGDPASPSPCCCWRRAVPGSAGRFSRGAAPASARSPDGALLRPMILSACSVAAAVQLAFSAFLLGILELPGGDARSRLTGLREAIGAAEA